MKTISPARLHSTSKAPTGFKHRTRLCLLLSCLCVPASMVTAFAQTPKIKITDPLVKTTTDLRSQGPLELSFTVSGSEITKVRVIVFQIDVTKGISTTLDTTKKDVDIDADKTEQSLTANLFKGLNKVQITALRDGTPDPKVSASISVTCTGKKCGAAAPAEAEAGDHAKPPEKGGNISILQPLGANVDNGLISSVITVKKSPIQRVFIQVINDGKTVEQSKSLLGVKYADELALLTPRLRVGKGKNIITVFNPDEPIETTDKFSTTVTCTGDKCDTPDVAKETGGIRIETPEGGAKLTDANAVSKITVDKKSGIEHLFVMVLNKGKEVKQENNPIAVDYGDKAQVALTPTIRIGEGKNIITVFDADKSLADSPQDSTEVTCKGNCGKEATASTSEITIEEPKTEGDEPYRADNISSIDSYVTVKQGSKIKNIQYDVVVDGKPVFTSEPQPVNPTTEKADKVKVRLKFLRGPNTIRIYDAAKPYGDNQTAIVIDCRGDNCASDFLVSTIVTNSQNTRLVVGFEQAGASSTTSETKPFLDFSFTSPFIFDTLIEGGKPKKGADGREIRVPRAAAWGQIRLASTPDQITTTGVFPTNLVNQVGRAGTAGNLVQSFDFLAGLEIRAFSANGSFLSLIPGIRQKTRFYIAGGAGAISPLTAIRESAQIFKIPLPNTPQYQPFIDRYGKPREQSGNIPAQEFVAFVPLDRDRFLRQWYAGLRVKTLYCEDEDCTRFRNQFPGTVDFMVGQNESVTGGRRKFGGAPDPTDSTKIIGAKNAYVFRIDAFYPLPFRETRFLYLYGTAMMKIGGGRANIVNPLFLDPASILITDPKVFIPSSNLQELLQPNRDYYKIGVGINLTELFNRNKTSPQR